MKQPRHAPSVRLTPVQLQNARRERIALRIIYAAVGLLALSLLLLTARHLGT